MGVLCLEKLKYYELLAEQYKNENSAITEMINLQAITNLPKGTEHFLSDIHGEFESFHHILKNASGAIKMYIDEIFGQSMTSKDKRDLALLIYYPEERMDTILDRISDEDKEDYFTTTLYRLVRVLKRSTAKYTRSKVRKALPKEYAYILEELIHEDAIHDNKAKYYEQIINTIVETDCEREFIVAMSKVIQRLVVDHLHIIGDIYDRGRYPDKVMDLLCQHHSLDIQWGNHDICWLGANAGSQALCCFVTRVCARHNNLQVLEDAYGINLVPLVRYAIEMFKDDDCKLFFPKGNVTDQDSEKDLQLVSKIHKAITLLQLKVEAELIKRRPEYHMNGTIFIDKIDFERKLLILDGKKYKLRDHKFQSLDKENPLFITKEERTIVNKLTHSFMNSDRLTRHSELFMKKGKMYTICNDNLLFHGCIPMNEDGEFEVCTYLGAGYYGKELLDELDRRVHNGYFDRNGIDSQKNLDLMWYLACGKGSPLFGKDKMAYFEQYFVDDELLKKETKDPYYSLRNQEKIALKILNEFGLSKSHSKIINGHVPVEVKKGESPVKANGKLIVIDGGLTKAYQNVTGIAGYTLMSNSIGMWLAEHEAFVSKEDIIKNGNEVISKNMLVDRYQERILVKDTDKGKIILEKVEELKGLIHAYRKGIVAETSE